MQFVRAKLQLSQITQPAFLVLLLVTGSVFVGCAKPKVLHPVTGSVRVKGKPAEGARLVFHPETDAIGIASAVTEDDGSFVLVSSAKSGVEAGKYRVTIVWPDMSKLKPDPFGQLNQPDPPDQLGGRYALLKDSKLDAEITSDTTELPVFDLK